MNSIEEKKNKTLHDVQFDKLMKNTKMQIEQINKGIEIKKHIGKNSYTHHSGNKNFYLDEVTKYFQGKGFVVKLRPTESVVSYKIYFGW